MNTYGLFSVNVATFNQVPGSDIIFPQSTRDTIVRLLKIHNCVLNVLGYIPFVSCVSGLVRMGTGTGICIATLALGNPNEESGIIIGRLYDEALYTGITQICRGILEVCFPVGWFVNIALDVVATPFNCIAGAHYSDARENGVSPHPDPQFPFPICLFNYA